MTTDNPDPLEVWREACGKYEDACEAGDTLRDGVILGDQAAAAIIAQHYAPVIAEKADLEALVGELGEALKPFADIRTQCPESIKLIQKNVDGMKPITITVTKVQMQTAVATLAKLEKARG